MLVDPKKYRDYDLVLELGNILRQCINEDEIPQLQQYGYSIADNEGGIDFDGIEVSKNPNIKMYGIEILNAAYSFIEDKFSPAIEFAKKISSLHKFNIVLIGPKSFVPHHVDDQDKPIYGSVVEYNFVTGLYVPSYNIEEIGIDINGLKINHEQPFVFNRQFPHKAWNKTDKFWSMYVLYIDTKEFL